MQELKRPRNRKLTPEQKQELKQTRKRIKSKLKQLRIQLNKERSINNKKMMFGVVLLIIIVIASGVGVWYVAKLDTDRRADCEKFGGDFISMRGNSALCVDKTDKIIKRYGFANKNG